MIHEIYRLLVVEYKLVTSVYFLDEMEDWEVADLLSMLEYTDRPDWEQTRFLIHTIAQVNSSKPIDQTQLLSLPWDDKKENNEHNHTVTDEDIKVMTERMKNIIQNAQL